MKKIFPYNYINNTILERMSPTIGERTFMYCDSDSWLPLAISPIGLDVFSISDPKYNWHPRFFNLRFKRTITLEKPVQAYSPILGITTQESEIGIGLKVFCKDTDSQYCYECGSFTSSDKAKIFEQDITIDAGFLSGRVFFETFFYLKKWASNDRFLQRCAQIPGSYLGNFDIFELVIDGNGSIFPIQEVSDKAKPLWWISNNITEPKEETLTADTFCLIINKAHKDYDQLFFQDNTKHSPLFIEIVSSCLISLIMSSTDNLNKSSPLLNQTEIEDESSIAYTIKYFKDVLNWNFENLDRLSESIRTHLSKKSW